MIGSVPLDRQLRDLDLLIADPTGYAQVWLNFASELGSWLLEILEDGTERASVWTPADDHFEERNRQIAALRDHATAHGHKPAIVRLLQVRGPIFRHREVR